MAIRRRAICDVLFDFLYASERLAESLIDLTADMVSCGVEEITCRAFMLHLSFLTSFNILDISILLYDNGGRFARSLATKIGMLTGSNANKSSIMSRVSSRDQFSSCTVAAVLHSLLVFGIMYVLMLRLLRHHKSHSTTSRSYQPALYLFCSK